MEENWYQIVMFGNEIRAGKNARMQAEFDGLLTSSTGPNRASLYIRKDANITGKYIYYISPSASVAWLAFAAKYGGSACAEPDIAELRPVALP